MYDVYCQDCGVNLHEGVTHAADADHAARLHAMWTDHTVVVRTFTITRIK